MTRTRPKQAGSARSLDRWQRLVVEILKALKFCPCQKCQATHRTCRVARRHLTRLLASLQKAERR